MKKLKLFVWEGNGVLTDYTNGMICVLAHSFQEAMELIAKESPHSMDSFPSLKYKIYEEPKAFLCYGGG